MKTFMNLSVVVCILICNIFQKKCLLLLCVTYFILKLFNRGTFLFFYDLCKVAKSEFFHHNKLIFLNFSNICHVLLWVCLCVQLFRKIVGTILYVLLFSTNHFLFHSITTQ